MGFPERILGIIWGAKELDLRPLCCNPALGSVCEVTKEDTMRLSKILTAAAMVSLVAAPVAAQASDNLPARAASQDDGQGIAGVSTVIIILGILAVIGIIVLIADNGHNHPTSP